MKTGIIPSVFIGLGGAGIQSILRTKADLLDSFGHDGELPPFLSFLGIDTDAGEWDRTVSSARNGEVRLSAREQLSIGVRDPKEYIMNNKREMTWMPEENLMYLSSLDHGAGSVRSNGRLAFMYNSLRLKEQLEGKVWDVVMNLGNTWHDVEMLEGPYPGRPSADVYVVFSLCGGTGSGVFIDLAYLLREIARDRNIELSLHAYGILPSVFMEEIRNPIAKSHILPNTYAALRELDYLMSWEDNRQIQLPWAPEPFEEKPFDSIVLIDNRNDAGIMYHHMCELSHVVSNALCANLGQVGSSEHSISDNIYYDMITKVYDVNDKAAWMSGVGVSAITYDSGKVAEVYSLKMQNKLINELLFTDHDSRNIADGWIDRIHIRSNHDRTDVLDELYNLGVITKMDLPSNMISRRNAQSDVENKIEKYVEAYSLEENEWYEKVDAMYDRTVNHLVAKEAEISEVSVGLWRDFLRDLQRIIKEIFILKLEEEHRDLREEQIHIRLRLDEAVGELANCMQQIFHIKLQQRIDAVQYTAEEYLLSLIDSERHRYALEFYHKLEAFIEDELSKVESLVRIFADIREENEKMIRILQNGENYSYRLATIDLAEDVIKRIEINPMDVSVCSFMEKLPHRNLFTTQDKSVYQEALQEYSHELRRYQELQEQTVDEVLDAMPQEDFDNLIRRAADMSKTFLGINDRGYNLLSTGRPVGKEEMFFIGVPDRDTNRLTRDRYYLRFPGFAEANIIQTGMKDRILIYRQKRPMPAFVIKDLEKMELAYQREIGMTSPHIDSTWAQEMEDIKFSIWPARDE